MFISEYKKNGVKVLELQGRIDSTQASFETEMHELVAKEDKVVIDCINLNYISSFGLRAFLSTLKSVQKEQGAMVIANLQENVKNVFEISGFLKLFNIYNTLDEALTSLKS
ncbi:MAG TPA: STAS domain-containing protein [Candidatus Kapabacteria bacterium]|nr:STAS domain-containing protein [Candidatus Kapabacteria bacterium]HPO62183.1 STAS domain-containing protein [Candidatus Kapabacteria bacterium]